MNTSGLEITIGKLQRVHDRMKPSVNKAILLDAITQLREQVKLFSMHFVSNNEVAVCPDCGCNKLQHNYGKNHSCLNAYCNWQGQTDC